MRVTISSSIIALQLLCAVQPAFAASVPAEDLGVYGTSMSYAKTSNVLTPLGDGLWHPELPLTRMDLISSIVGSVYKEDVNDNCFQEIAPDRTANYTNLFRDISRTSKHSKEVCVAMFVGILQGKPDGSLKPEQSANLVEAAKMISKAYGIAPFPGLKPQPGVPWHEPFWYALARRNAIPKTVVSRNATLTRGEFAEIMYALRDDKPVIGFREKTTKVGDTVTAEVAAQPKTLTKYAATAQAESTAIVAATTVPEAAPAASPIESNAIRQRAEERREVRIAKWGLALTV